MHGTCKKTVRSAEYVDDCMKTILRTMYHCGAAFLTPSTNIHRNFKYCCNFGPNESKRHKKDLWNIEVHKSMRKLKIP